MQNLGIWAVLVLATEPEAYAPHGSQIVVQEHAEESELAI